MIVLSSFFVFVYPKEFRFYEVYCEVEPKRQALEKANAELKAAREKLDSVNRQVAVRTFVLRFSNRKLLESVVSFLAIRRSSS